MARVRKELVELLGELGSVHLQLAKSYRFRERLRPESFELVRSLKKELDPDNRINPGNLGL